MYIDDSIVKSFISKRPCEEYNKHWIFSVIEDEYVFEEPSIDDAEYINQISEKIKNILTNIELSNEEYVKELLPESFDILNNMHILLCVGCPISYDVMVREYEGVEYLIFDVVRMAEYERASYDISSFVSQMVVHEVFYNAINKVYPYDENATYIQKLNRVVFLEGYIQFLVEENIQVFMEELSYDSSTYETSKSLLLDAYTETDEEVRQNWLDMAESEFGGYLLKAYLGMNIAKVKYIFNHESDHVCELILGKKELLNEFAKALHEYMGAAINGEKSHKKADDYMIIDANGDLSDKFEGKILSYEVIKCIEDSNTAVALIKVNIEGVWYYESLVFNYVEGEWVIAYVQMTRHS